ncbi:MAG: cyclopropane-fatty-acyl-phospholipid synthase family protein [Acidimicrobiales bacterium]
MKSLLGRVRKGTILLVDGGAEHRYGEGAPIVRVTIHDRRAYGAAIWHSSIGLGSSYFNGWWDCDDLTGLLQILLRAVTPSTQRKDRWARRLAPVLAPLTRIARTDWKRDRDNIRAHYDISNDFFQLMLDETMAYSCAYFEDPSVSLADASREKFDRLCRKLNIGPDDHVLEIGTGWGGFALHAAKVYGARVTTTTISDAQFEHASKLVVDAGLSDLVTVLNRDYRDLEGLYDKVVSIEMIEAIGWRQLDTYFATCSKLLKPDGLMGLQAIVIEDQSYERAKKKEDFIKRYIFPGGFLPSTEALLRSMSSVTDLRIRDIEDIGRHYAETLRLWRGNLDDNREALEALNLGAHFERMWRFYLSYCEAAFLERHISCGQFVLSRNAWHPAFGQLA